MFSEILLEEWYSWNTLFSSKLLFAAPRTQLTETCRGAKGFRSSAIDSVGLLETVQ